MQYYFRCLLLSQWIFFLLMINSLSDDEFNMRCVFVCDSCFQYVFFLIVIVNVFFQYFYSNDDARIQKKGGVLCIFSLIFLLLICVCVRECVWRRDDNDDTLLAISGTQFFLHCLSWSFGQVSCLNVLLYTDKWFL